MRLRRRGEEPLRHAVNDLTRVGDALMAGKEPGRVATGSRTLSTGGWELPLRNRCPRGPTARAGGSGATNLALVATGLKFALRQFPVVVGVDRLELGDMRSCLSLGDATRLGGVEPVPERLTLGLGHFDCIRSLL